MRNISAYLWQVQLLTAKQCSYSIHSKITVPYLISKRNVHTHLLYFYNSDLRHGRQVSKIFKRELSDIHQKSPSVEPPSNIRQLLEFCEKQLQKEEISEAQLDVEYIISRALNINRIDLPMYKDHVVSSETLSRINEMMRCRLARMPIQYIFGDWDFHSVTLKMRPPVFIPRPETEELVNLSVRALRETEVSKPLALDICCGSGAISLALLKMVPELTCVALDQSKYAVDLTLENAQDLCLADRLHVVKGKVTEKSFPNLPFDKYDLIVSNPPYVLKKDLGQLQPEISLYEDMRALYGGEEGMDVIVQIILHGQFLLKEEGRLLLEIDPQHFYSIPSWLERNKTTLEICQFNKDLNGMHRYIELKKTKN